MTTQRRIGVLVGHDPFKAEAIASTLERGGHRVTLLPLGPTLEQALRSAALDVVFIASAEPLESGVQQLLERHHVPYTGPGVHASALACDRVQAKAVFRRHNLATPTGYTITPAELDELDARHLDLGFPCVVTPTKGQGPGVVVHSSEHLRQAVLTACASSGVALVERFVKGRAVAVCVLGGEVLGCADVSGEKLAAPRLSATRVANLEAIALAAWRALECRGAARIDFLCPEVGNEVVVGLDPMPTLAPNAVLPRLAKQRGLTFAALCARLLDLATTDGGAPGPFAGVSTA